MIRMRYAIDKKPTYYKNFEGKEFSVGRLKGDNEEYIAEENLDWRELIF
jgi:hypothetical protein